MSALPLHAPLSFELASLRDKLPHINPEGFKPHFIENLPDDQYHADRSAVSSTALKKILVHSPKTFYADWVLGVKEDRDTDAMRFGRIIHKAILEGDEFKKKVIVMPEFLGLTKDGRVSAQSGEARDKKNQWLADQAPDALIVTEEERFNIIGMISSVMSHKKAVALLENSKPEVSGYWVDEETGIKCRCRWDSLNVRWFTDLKSTKDCSEKSFYWDIFGTRFSPIGYDFQLAMYYEGFKNIFGYPPDLSTWLAVEKVAPWEIAVHPGTGPTLDVGQIKVRRALRILRNCIDTGDWPGKQGCDDVSFIVPDDFTMAEYGINHERELV